MDSESSILREKPVTKLLRRIANGDRDAKNQLFDLILPELRKMADNAMQGQPVDHTLQPTALLNEAAVRLLEGRALSNLRDRSAFFAVAARTMQSVLVDYARKRAAMKRPSGNGRNRVMMDDVIDHVERIARIDVLALDCAMQQLERQHQRSHQIVTLHFFGGLSFPAIAEHLGFSLSTIEKDWKFARCWLLRELDSHDDD